MAILDTEVRVAINAPNRKHFESMGYKIPKVKNKWGRLGVPRGFTVFVKVNHLNEYSRVKVSVKCDFCNIKYKTSYCNIVKQKLYKKTKEVRCKKCCDRNRSGAENPMYKWGNGYRSYKAAAIKRGFSFNLSVRQFRLITNSKCHYCNGVSNFNYYKEMVNGIDRIDSSIGYSMKNCVPCCSLCNQAKNDLNYKEFKSWLKRISKHFLKK